MSHPSPLCDELKRLAPGDRWEYDLTGTISRDGRELKLTGQVIVTIERRATARGELNAIVFEQQRRLVGAAADDPDSVLNVPTGLFYFIQDPDRLDVAIVGDNMGPKGQDRFAAAPQVFYPGRWSSATGYRNVLDFGADGRVENWLITEGPTEIEVALSPGRFMAWRAAIGSDSPQFGQVTGYDYWTPQLGAPIRFEMMVTGPDGSPVSTQARMRATNVLSR